MRQKLAFLAFFLALLLSFSGCRKIEDDDAVSENKTSSGSPQSSSIVVPPMSEPQSDLESETESGAKSETSAPPVLTPNYTDLTGLDNKKNGWGQGTQVDKENRPLSCTAYQEKYGKYGAVFIKENNRDFYLTFDEGYENGYTAKILDVLKEKKAPAVFFVTYDYVKRNPELIRRMIEEGHVVGNHSWSHPSMPSVSLEKAAEEITKLHDYVKENFGYEMTLFRPPMGEYSEQTLALAQQLGYQTVFWSYAYKDWDPKNQPEEAGALERAMKYVHGGAVYLLHAVSETNTNMLGSMIDGIRDKGYELKALR